MNASSVLLVIPVLLASISSQQPSAPSPNTGPSHVATANPQSPLDYFRRADDLTNIRLPGSTPFHMKVTFHAYPGIDFAAPGKSDILTGDGTYEETWLAPDKWRREVTLGSYHAVEIRADGARKFQASQDYEPGRVLMLLKALLYPIPREILEPEIQEHITHWRVDHKLAGALPWVRIGFTEDSREYGPHPRAYDFLPDGILIRSEDYNGLVTSWQDDRPFGAKLVPRHFEVQGASLDGKMVSADLAISPLAPNADIAQIAGPPASPGMTLRPFDSFDAKTLPPTHFQVPEGWASLGHDADAPPGIQVYASVVIDRQGMPREAELSGLRRFGQPIEPSQFTGLAIVARHDVESLRKDRFRPGQIDGQPCQYVWGVTIWTTPTVQ